MSNQRILFRGKAREFADFTAYIKNAYPNMTLEEYMEVQNEKDMDL